MNTALFEKYILGLTDVDAKSIKANQEYFYSLLEKLSSPKEVNMTIHQPEEGIESSVVPFCIAEAGDLKNITIQKYKGIEENPGVLSESKLVLYKMHAGLGTSVERKDIIKKVEGRTELGSKGTDLFIEVDGVLKSLAELQWVQCKAIEDQKIYKSVEIQNLVNEETLTAVSKISKKEIIEGKTYSDIVSTRENILQLKMPTINEEGELTLERLAPAGHAFLGFAELMNIFEADTVKDEIIVIGNGEDLNSTADPKITSWMVEYNIPMVMITTTKLEKDKKGGQISLVKNNGKDYVTIIEKAQAEKANQLDYFEKLGLRDGDNESLFNTNIVVINKKSLKQMMNEFLGDLSKEKFSSIIAPDLIKNTKEQDGKKFTQLEGAIGSTILNLDQFFRVNHGAALISFINLDPEDREKFFIPIKKIDDFNKILESYNYDKTSGRFQLKEK